MVNISSFLVYKKYTIFIKFSKLKYSTFYLLATFKKISLNHLRFRHIFFISMYRFFDYHFICFIVNLYSISITFHTQMPGKTKREDLVILQL